MVKYTVNGIVLNFLLSAGSSMDLNSSLSIASPIQQLGCPSPQPFIQNTNSSVAFLSGNVFNGTQPEDAGIYSCFVGGLPRATVEVIVLCMSICSLICKICVLLRIGCISVPQSPTQSEAFFRLSVISRDMLAQVLGEPLILSNCIQTLGTVVC